MKYHPHLTIALAEDRIAEHRRWAERQRRVNSARPSRRHSHLFDTLARRLHRPVRSWEPSVPPQLTPAA